jgi:hypothetical protein
MSHTELKQMAIRVRSFTPRARGRMIPKRIDISRVNLR